MTLEDAKNHLLAGGYFGAVYGQVEAGERGRAGCVVHGEQCGPEPDGPDAAGRSDGGGGPQVGGNGGGVQAVRRADGADGHLSDLSVVWRIVRRVRVIGGP